MIPSPQTSTHSGQENPGPAAASPSRQGTALASLLDRLLAEAVARRASDLHLEPSSGDGLRARWRIDGHLHDAPVPLGALAPALAAEVKIRSGLSLAERRRPQDGRFHLDLEGQPIRRIGVRVSCIPCLRGESLVLRLLDGERTAPALDAIGLPATVRAALLDALSRPEGLVLVTGPTGAGKTTTLYAALRHINRLDRKIITVEDPVEYPIAGLQQVGVCREAGLTFASAVRAMLRQAPDVILIGEIRDEETAAIAAQAALTGHLVLGTLHASDCVAALRRLTDLGIEPSLAAGTLRLTLAQRLVRRLCPACSQRRPALPHEAALLGGSSSVGEASPSGCPSCGESGYRGRNALFEALSPGEALRRAWLVGAGPETLRTVARSGAWRPLFEEGLEAVRRGETTLEELLAAASAG